MSSKSIEAKMLLQQSVSVTRQMAAALPRLKALAESKGLKLHHLGAGYPHLEVSDPTTYIAHKRAYFQYLAEQANSQAPDVALKALLTESYGYTDTLGPKQSREAFAQVYGHDFGFKINPDLLLPTIGATGGISLVCSIFERSCDKIAYIVDAPTYTGFVSRAILYQKSNFYSVEIKDDGPDPKALRSQIKKAREDGCFVAFYYTVPDGHNPGGISFSQKRREEIMNVAREEGIFIVEDAPYTYISYESAENRPQPFIAIDPKYSAHLFTASKIGLPGPRVGFIYTEVETTIANDNKVQLQDLLMTEASGNTLLHNPEALRGFEAYLMDENFQLHKSLWPIAAKKNEVYGENRQILLDGLDKYLGEFKDYFTWTKPGAGFFSVFTFKKGTIKTDQEFIEKLIGNHGVVTVPMFGFYPSDARDRNPDIGLNQLRLSFSFSERVGDGRKEDLQQAVRAFANAVRIESGLPGLDQ